MAEPNSRAVPAAGIRPLPVIVNREGGAAARLGRKLAPTIEQAFAEAGLPIALHCVAGAEVAALVKQLDAPVVVVGGGDGTLGAAAGVLADTTRTLAILPLGTRNHLAGELGVPGDLVAAAKLIAAGPIRRIDLGCIDPGGKGQRIFINNCSVGLYTRLVRERDDGWSWLPKWLATFPAALRIMRSARSQHFRLDYGGSEHRLESPLLFIGNNHYSLDAGRIGKRDSLDDGALSLACVAPASPRGLIAMGLRLIVGRADAERDFSALEDVPALTVFGYHRRDVAIDGEVMRMKFPLRLHTLPSALSVIAPPAGAVRPA